MFFVLHANTCGPTISHHGHSHRCNHGHAHNHHDDVLVVNHTSRQSQEEVVKQTISSKNINVQAAIIHVIGDFVQSIGVLFAAILIKIKVCSWDWKKEVGAIFMGLF